MVGKSYSLFRFQKLWLNFYTLLYAFRFSSCCGRSLSNPRSLHVSNVRLRNHLSYLFLLGSGFTNFFFSLPLPLSLFSFSLVHIYFFDVLKTETKAVFRDRSLMLWWKTRQWRTQCLKVRGLEAWWQSHLHLRGTFSTKRTHGKSRLRRVQYCRRSCKIITKQHPSSVRA